MKDVYLDHAAATPLDPRVAEAMEPYLREEYGNPSSIHEKGRRAKEAIENARKTVARILGCRPSEIIFTGSGTETVNLGIFGVARHCAWRGSPPHLITTKIEHHAVLGAVEQLEKEGCEVMYLDVDRHGLIDQKKLKAALRPDTILISVMYVNNEIGTIEPIEDLGKLIKEYHRMNSKFQACPVPNQWFWRGVPSSKFPILFVDACQAAGYLDLNVDRLGVDLMALNGSKIYGPKGIGCLYVRSGIELEPVVYGGGQERGLRSGTENVAGIVGFAKALELAQGERVKESERLTVLRDYFIKEVLQRIPDAVLNGHPTQRLPNNINISIPGIEGEAVVIYLDARGIQCSTGSACSSTAVEPSHVLLALGKSREEAGSSLRFTFGRETRKDDIDFVLQMLPEVVAQLRPIPLLRGSTSKQKAGLGRPADVSYSSTRGGRV